MKFGIVTFYSYRPHVEHMAFLGKQLTKAGHEVIYLECSGSFGVCNKNISVNSSLKRQFNCFVCKNLGLRSYSHGEVTRLSPVSTVSNAKTENSLIERLSRV